MLSPKNESKVVKFTIEKHKISQFLSNFGRKKTLTIMQNFFFLAKLCHLVTQKKEKKAVQNIQRIFLKKMAQITHILRGGGKD
jgi:hypothetical protein